MRLCFSSYVMSKSLQCKTPLVFSCVSHWVFLFVHWCDLDMRRLRCWAVCTSALKTRWELCFVIQKLRIVPLPVFTPDHSQVHFLFLDLTLPSSSLYCTGLKKSHSHWTWVGNRMTGSPQLIHELKSEKVRNRHTQKSQSQILLLSSSADCRAKYTKAVWFPDKGKE